MKTKQTLILILSLYLSFFGNAQKLEKVKGNRIVTLQQTFINSFHTLSIDEDFEVDIIYGKEASLEIEADENLHEFITFEVRDSVLSFNKTRKITSKKELRIKINYDDNLKIIETFDNSKVNALTLMELSDFKLLTYGSSKVGLTLKSDFFDFEGVDKSKVKLNLSCDSTNIILNGNSKLEALINAPKIYADLYQKTDAIIEGNSDNINIRTDNNASFIGKNLTVKTGSILAEISSDVTLEAIDSITIDASGSSSIYLYQNPKITVNKLSGTSKIQKKVK